MNRPLLRIPLFFFLVLSTFLAFSQTQTIGLLHSSGSVSEGYTLFTPENNTSVYLIDNCGEVINQWNFSEKPALTCYLLPNGNLLRAGQDSLEIRDWNNNLVWSYSMTANGLRQHHDIEPLPNGNILCILADIYSKAAMVAQGRDPSLVSVNFKIDKIVEIQPIGTNEASIVWEWKFFNHFVQQYDSLKPNYGHIEDHPELIDLNYPNSNGNDFTHLNAIDYNPSLDQIIISARNLNEIYIIDHSTTIAEAAGHTGGNSNRGGDILWRWGNPEVYGQGSLADQKLFLQHDARWIDPSFPDASKISVFNNCGDSTNTFSAIHLISPVISGGVYSMNNGKFEPLSYDYSWQGNIMGNLVYQKAKGGVSFLSNGNFLICETTLGQVSELTKSGAHIWTYRNPSGFNIYNQYSIPAEDISIFRAEKYSENFSGFIGKNMSPKGIIENLNSLSDSCAVYAGIDGDIREGIIVINPSESGRITFSHSISVKNLVIFDLTGREVYSCGAFEGREIEPGLPPAIYIIRLQMVDRIETVKIHVLN